jgi:hypothetical protein
MTKETTYRVNFADCYVLSNKRDKAFIETFLNHFLPHRKAYATEYEVPQFAEHPTTLFQSADELIAYLEVNQNELHAIYWYNLEEGGLTGAMCLFTSDGQVIFGITCKTLHPDTTNEAHYLQALLHFCNSTQGLIEYDTPAARDTAAFLQRITAQKETKG